MKKVGNMMKKIVVNLMIVALAGGPAWAWSHAGRWGGSMSHSFGSTSHSSRWGTSTSHTFGEGTSHANAYGGSTTHYAGRGNKPHERFMAAPLRAPTGTARSTLVPTAGPQLRLATTIITGGHTPLSIRPSL